MKSEILPSTERTASNLDEKSSVPELQSFFLSFLFYFFLISVLAPCAKREKKFHRRRTMRDFFRIVMLIAFGPYYSFGKFIGECSAVCSVISIAAQRGEGDCNSSCTREIDGNCIIRGMKSDNNGNDESFWGGAGLKCISTGSKGGGPFPSPRKGLSRVGLNSHSTLEVERERERENHNAFYRDR